MAPTFSGGKLKLKGDKKAKKKTKKSKHKTRNKDEEKMKLKNDHVEEKSRSDDEDIDDDLTPAERRSLNLKKDRERQEMEKIAGKSHRERVEEFNEKLGKLTEHNDIPRVSRYFQFDSIIQFIITLQSSINIDEFIFSIHLNL